VIQFGHGKCKSSRSRAEATVGSCTTGDSCVTWLQLQGSTSLHLGKVCVCVGGGGGVSGWVGNVSLSIYLLWLTEPVWMDKRACSCGCTCKP
jgi:hypothetical protein